MKWFLNLSTRSKLSLSFGLMIVFLLGAVFSAYSGVRTIQKSEENLYSREFANATDLLLIRANQNGVRADLMSIILDKDPARRSELTQDLNARDGEVDQIVPKLAERVKDDPELSGKLQAFEAVRNAYRSTRNTEISLLGQKKSSEVIGLATVIQADRDAKMRKIADDLVNGAENKAASAVALSRQEAANLFRNFALVSALAILAAIALATLINQSIARPLKGISDLALQVAEGDLAVRVNHDGRADEVGILLQTFGKMVKNLRQVTKEIREGVSVLASSASEIVAATTQVASGAAETAAAVSETTTTVEEVKQTAHLSSQKSRLVSESAQKAAQVSLHGKKSVGDSIEKMQLIKEQMESVAENIMRLSEQSQAIGEIIALVNDLAEQSNLLAVNASIEAAKAGEQGKGFSVVAQEIRSMAEQSKQATIQVRSILGDIQKATSAAVMSTERGNKAVEAGVQQSTEAGEAIGMLGDSITEAAQAAQQIAASSQQQLVGMDQVALAMENIKQASGQNVASTKQAEVGAQNLHELGQKLKQLVEQYKV